MNRIKAYILNRLDELQPRLETAQAHYRRTKDESWAGAVQEYAGRIHELQKILTIIEHYE